MSSDQIMFLLFLLFASTFYTLHAAPIPEDETDVSDNKTMPKIPKCCPMDQALLDPKIGCVPSPLDFKPYFTGRAPEEVDIIVGFNCQYGKYRLEPEEASEDEFHLLADGTLSVPFQEQPLFSPMEYCMDNTLVHDEAQILPFLCFPPPTDTNDSWRKFSHILFPIGSLISVPFLVIVVILYLGVPELRTTYGKVLACHSACLAFAYFSLSLVQVFGEELPQTLCITMAFVIQFSFMSCFFWLNVLCLHTWRQLNKGFPLHGSNSIGNNLLFVFYSLYGWGVPVIIISISVVMDLTPAIPSNFKPNFGLDSCWFHSDSAALPYFYGPVALILVSNIFLFLLTTRIIFRRGTRVFGRIRTLEEAAMGVIEQRRKQSFFQSVLLFLAMGLSWLLEVTSWAVGGPPELWIITDFWNTLQGIFVFYIFVVQDPWVRRLGKKYFSRICCCREDTSIVVPENNVRRNNDDEKRPSQQMIPLVPLANGR